MGEKKKIYRSEKEWRKIIESQKKSGLSEKRYCETEKINVWSFRRWNKKISQGKNATGDLEAFIKVKSPAIKLKETLKIKTPKGYWIEIPQGIPRTFLRETISVLEGK